MPHGLLSTSKGSSSVSSTRISFHGKIVASSDRFRNETYLFNLAPIA